MFCLVSGETHMCSTVVINEENGSIIFIVVHLFLVRLLPKYFFPKKVELARIGLVSYDYEWLWLGSDFRFRKKRN